MTTLYYLKSWFLLAVTATLLCGLVYLSAQQTLRQGANDPQIQMAQDIAVKLSSGRQQASDFSLAGKVDIAKSLAPFVIVYTAQGKPIAGTGELNEVMPTLPPGVFGAATQNGENRITWQPQNKVRSALVITPYKDGFVVVGRSLREIENRESNLLIATVIAWAITLAVTLGITFLFYRNETAKIKLE